MGYHLDRLEQLSTSVQLGHARIFNEDVIFLVPSSQEGGIDIKAGSSTMHMLKHCSVHHPEVQIVLFPIEHVSQDTFCCPHIMVPKAIRDTIEKASLFEGAPLNPSGYGEERRDPKMYALRAGVRCSSSAGTLVVPPLWLDSGATHHMVGDRTILINLRNPARQTPVVLADGSEYAVTQVGDILSEDFKINDVNVVPGLEMCLVSVRQLAESGIFTTFYKNHVELWQEGTQIGGAIIDGAESLYGLCFLQAPCLQEGGIDIKVASRTMHMAKHCSLFKGAPLNPSGYGEERHVLKMYALMAGVGCSSSAGTLVVPPLWLDSGATHHVVGDRTILINLRNPARQTFVVVADGSGYPATQVGDILSEYFKINDVIVVPGLKTCLVSVRQLAESGIFTTFYKKHAELWLEGTWTRTLIGLAFVDKAALLYRLDFLQAP